MEADSPIEIIGDMKVHPAASLFPLIEGEEFDELVFSIKTLGVLQPIIVSNGYLIDGRNRLRAVQKLRLEGCKIDLPVEEFDKDVRSVSEFIFELNFTRRHLTPDQMATICADVLPMISEEKNAKREATQFKPGDPRQNPGGKPKPVADTESYPPQQRDIKQKNEQSTIGQIAKLAGVSHHKARQAVAVAKAVEAGNLPKEVIQEVRQGTKKLVDVVPKPKPVPKPVEEKEPSKELDYWPKKQSFEDIKKAIDKYFEENFISVDFLRMEIAEYLNKIENERKPKKEAK